MLVILTMKKKTFNNRLNEIQEGFTRDDLAKDMRSRANIRTSCVQKR